LGLGEGTVSTPEGRWTALEECAARLYNGAPPVKDSRWVVAVGV